MLVLVGLLGGLAAAPAGASSVGATFSADPTQDKPITVTVSGSASASRMLSVYLRSSGSCAATPSGEFGVRLSPAGGVAVSGSFSRDYAFTPSARTEYRVCSYLTIGTASGTVDVAAVQSVIPRAAQASVAVAFSADPTQDKPVSVSVTGWTEVSRALEVYLRSSGSCSATPSGEYGIRLSPGGGQAVNGSFSHEYTFTPTGDGARRICAYIVGENGGSADATTTGELTVRRVHATVGVGVAAAVAAGEPFTVSLAGTSEMPRSLEAYVRTSGTCSATPAGEYGTRLTPGGGQAVNGSFSHSYSYTPRAEAVHQICAYVVNGGDGGTEAAGTGTVTVGNPARSTPPNGRDVRGEDPPDAAPATLVAFAAGLVGTSLKPTFRWTSADVGRDILVLEYRRNQRENFAPYIAVWTHGAAWMSEDDFEDADTIVDALAKRENRAAGWASFTTEGTGAAVAFKKGIDPGRYRWFVYTGFGSASGTLVPSEQREFIVHGPVLRNLRVSTRARKGSSTKSPGETTLRISVTRFASVRIELRRGGKRSVRNLAAGNATKLTAPVEWSCKKPGGRYRYRVIARDSRGKRLTRSGTFRPVSVARCRTMRKQEQRAKAARRREVDRRVAERRRAEAAAQQGRINRFKSNCRKLGGTPELIHSSDGSYWVCVAPWGGTWNVPY